MKKYIFSFSSILFMAGVLTLTPGCSKKDSPAPVENHITVTPKTVTSLEASSTVYFNLTTGQTIPENAITATNWDISFLGKDRTITISMNSGTSGKGTAGAQLVQTGFEDLTEAPQNGYLPGNEATGDYLKWSTYTGSTSDPKHAILPKPGLTIAVKTADGKYSKIQIISLYKGNPNTTTAEFADLNQRPAFGYFTFRYATQTDGSLKF